MLLKLDVISALILNEKFCIAFTEHKHLFKYKKVPFIHNSPLKNIEDATKNNIFFPDRKFAIPSTTYFSKRFYSYYNIGRLAYNM